MSIDKKELVRRVQERLSKGSGTVEKIIDATVEEIYESLKLGESVSLRNFGTFYVRVEREGVSHKVLLFPTIPRLAALVLLP